MGSREGVEVGYRLDPEAKWVEADAIQVQQILINLVRNAIEAMAGVEAPRVTISTNPSPDRMIMVQVEDNGPGLRDDLEQHLAPFQSSKPEGLGLGLSISRTIVEAHGGSLEGGSAPSGGAVMRFTLRRADKRG